MDFTSVNFGDLLFALNCDRLKNDIRKIEKINKRIVQYKNGIYFNEICLKEGLHPKFSNIYIYIYIWHHLLNYHKKSNVLHQKGKTIIDDDIVSVKVYRITSYPKYKRLYILTFT